MSTTLTLTPGIGPVVMSQIDSPLGELILGVQNDRLIGIWFDGQKHFDGPQEQWQQQPDHPVLFETQRQLQDYFAGKLAEFDLPLAAAGTPFQQKVWQALLKIPFSETVTYGQVADWIGATRGVRAVAAAIGRNPISVVIPCHRVIGANGKLTGYAGGLDRKRELLALEEDQHALC